MKVFLLFFVIAFASCAGSHSSLTDIFPLGSSFEAAQVLSIIPSDAPFEAHSDPDSKSYPIVTQVFLKCRQRQTQKYVTHGEMESHRTDFVPDCDQLDITQYKAGYALVLAEVKRANSDKKELTWVSVPTLLLAQNTASERILVKNERIRLSPDGEEVSCLVQQ